MFNRPCMKFLAFEGLDGSGKSSLMLAVEKELTAQGIRLHRTREPGGTLLGEDIRDLILQKKEGRAPVSKAELLLYEADRAQHVETVIKPRLGAGHWVLSDRFAASSVAFQAGGRNISEEDVQWLNKFATSDLKPDLYILLDVTVEESRRRRQTRASASGEKEDRIESEADEFHQRVRQGFLKQSQQDPKRWLVLDATMTTEEMLSKTLSELRQRKWLS